ncbi:hypothetical protein IscW_ISCW007468 [Ixodes scapularis]|uniref:Uncharacterized protein n=1 Tax=Ixodes scapularis TaxID=6945 RepID=B7PV36_IXOSC|nr:hypothetical protein IscW_ISCW007468 [Ixodes scapularis]|eukprot:XP_002407219.1 hypothetical protein IscW_ISCW007468 [Ixodes scapularis]
MSAKEQGDQKTSQKNIDVNMATLRITPKTASYSMYILIAVLAVVIFAALLVALFGGTPTPKIKAPMDINKARELLYSRIKRSMNPGADPCVDFYDYVCGNFESAYPGATDIIDAMKKELFLGWADEITPDQSQQSIVDKIVMALQICQEGGAKDQNHWSDLTSYIAQFGLGVDVQGTHSRSLLDVLVQMALMHHLPVTMIVQPKLNLKDTRRLILHVSYGGPIIASWLQNPASEVLAAVEKFQGVNEGFVKDVKEVDFKVRTWVQGLSSEYPAYKTIAQMSFHTPQINASMWSERFAHYLPLTLKPNETVYVRKVEGLILTNNLVNEYRNNPKVGFHWVTAVVEYYLFAAAMKDTKEHDVKCRGYIQYMAPFALNAIYFQRHLDTTQVELGKHMYRQFRCSIRQFFKWMMPEPTAYAQDRFQLTRLVLGVPDNLNSILGLETQFHYVPQFKEPFLTSFLSALKMRAEEDLFNFQMTRYQGSMAVDRWRLLYNLEAVETEEMSSFSTFSPAFMPYSMVVFLPAMLMLPPFMDTESVAFSYAGTGRLMAQTAMHAFDKDQIEKSHEGDREPWGYGQGRGFYERLLCLERAFEKRIPNVAYGRKTLSENVPDIAALELVLAALRSDSCYVPDRQSHVEKLTEKQLFFVAYCHGFCASKQHIQDYKAGEGKGPARSDHRCNVTVSSMTEFEQAFKCSFKSPRCSFLS